MKLGTLVAIVGLLAFLGTLGAASWGAWDIRQEVAENTDYRTIQTWQRMEAIRQKRRLSQVEWQKWCWAGIKLKIFYNCPRR